MVDYAHFINLAQRLISENGREVTLLSFDSALSDTDQPWLGSGDPRNNPDSVLVTEAVFVPPSGASNLGFAVEVSDLLKTFDQIMIVSIGAQRDPTQYNEVVDGTTNWKIQAIQVLRPGPSTVLVFMGLVR